LETYQLAGITGPELGKLFSGRIDTKSSAKSNYLSFSPGPNPDSSLAIEFSNAVTSTFELNGFPFLFGLAQTMDDEWFAKPVFESDVTGVIRREGGNVSISDINFQNKSWMALQGAVTMTADRRLSGTLEVGVAEAMIISAKNRRINAMFGPPKEGFRWITVKIGGGAGAPTDNFKELYESAATAEAPTPANKVPSFEDLTAPK
jgi:hypothetical protein